MTDDERADLNYWYNYVEEGKVQISTKNLKHEITVIIIMIIAIIMIIDGNKITIKNLNYAKFNNI